MIIEIKKIIPTNLFFHFCKLSSGCFGELVLYIIDVPVNQ